MLDLVEREDLLTRAKYIGERLNEVLLPLDAVQEVRGSGAMQGVVLNQDIAMNVEVKAREYGVITNVPLPHVIRLVPPLTVTDKELETGLDRLARAINDCSESS